jgi:hypothetical protein
MGRGGDFSKRKNVLTIKNPMKVFVWHIRNRLARLYILLILHPEAQNVYSYYLPRVSPCWGESCQREKHDAGQRGRTEKRVIVTKGSLRFLYYRVIFGKFEREFKYKL